MAMLPHYKYLMRVYKTIMSCNSAAQVECAIRYRDIVLKYLFSDNYEKYEHWETYFNTHLNTVALRVCGLIKEE